MPSETMDNKTRALNIISMSSNVDHESALLWGQWCRDVARAGLNGDSEALDEAERTIPESVRQCRGMLKEQSHAK